MFAENFEPCLAEEQLVGKKYITKIPIYIMAEYNDLDNKVINKEMARAYLHPVQLANRYFTAFQCEVPKGTTITILGRSPKPWYRFFSYEFYIVSLDPDPSRGVEVKLPLSDSFKGTIDGLNSEIFSPM